MKRRILVVDDEPNVLRGLYRMFRSLKNDWEIHVEEGAPAALAFLEDHEFDVVVSDMRMPVMDGAQFLGEVMRKYPHMVRIVLSGQSEQASTLNAVGTAHQFLAKPCDADKLREVVERACAVHGFLGNGAVLRAVSGMVSLPSRPSLYRELYDELSGEDATPVRVGRVIERDPGMTAKILQMVNSAFFGLPRQVSSPVAAAALLGMDTLRALAMTVQVFSQFESSRVDGFSIEDLQGHCLTTGRMAEAIARSEGADEPYRSNATMAGLLHDTGKLILATRFAPEYEAILARGVSEGRLLELETEAFGTTHAEIGAYLLGVWGLPDEIVYAVAFHHVPWKIVARGAGPMALAELIYVADFLVSDGTLKAGCPPEATIDREYLESRGLADRLDAWKALSRPGNEEGRAA